MPAMPRLAAQSFDDRAEAFLQDRRKAEDSLATIRFYEFAQKGLLEWTRQATVSPDVFSPGHPSSFLASLQLRGKWRATGRRPDWSTSVRLCLVHPPGRLV